MPWHFNGFSLSCVVIHSLNDAFVRRPCYSETGVLQAEGGCIRSVFLRLPSYEGARSTSQWSSPARRSKNCTTLTVPITGLSMSTTKCNHATTLSLSESLSSTLTVTPRTQAREEDELYALFTQYAFATCVSSSGGASEALRRMLISPWHSVGLWIGSSCLLYLRVYGLNYKRHPGT